MRTSAWRDCVRSCCRASSVNGVCLSGLQDRCSPTRRDFIDPGGLLCIQRHRLTPPPPQLYLESRYLSCNERLAALLRTIQGPFPFYSLLIVHSVPSSARTLRRQLRRNNRQLPAVLATCFYVAFTLSGSSCTDNSNSQVQIYPGSMWGVGVGGITCPQSSLAGGSIESVGMLWY